MTAVYHDTITRGDSYKITVRYKDEAGAPISLAGQTPKLQIRAGVGVAAVLLTLTVGSGLTVTPAAGQIDVRLSPLQTLALPLGRLAWDLEISDGTDTEQLVSGSFAVVEGVTA
jgi:hypothetical protein